MKPVWGQNAQWEGSFGGISDKIVQGYLPAYMRIAAELGPEARVCELGVLEGHSLRLWQDLFPLGEITGVDIRPYDPRWWPEGVRPVIMDSRDPGLPGALGGPFDLIIDDASHEGHATRTAFTQLWPLVAPGGYYVIEDWYYGLPPATGYPDGNEAILGTVQDLLRLLDRQEDSEADEITYRYGMAIVHRRR